MFQKYWKTSKFFQKILYIRARKRPETPEQQPAEQTEAEKAMMVRVNWIAFILKVSITV